MTAFPAQNRQNTRRVVCSEMIHQAVKRRLRIVIDEHGNDFPKSARISGKKEIDDRILQGIIHDAVKLIALEILPALAISDLVGGILPDFANDDGFGVLLLGSLPQLFKEKSGQLVCHIETISADAVAQPMLDDAILRKHERLVAFGTLTDRRQGVDPPPTVIMIAGTMEGVPIVIGRLG